MPPQNPKEIFIRSLSESQNRLYGHIYSLPGNHHEAAEVLQETNLVLWRKLDEFRAGSDFIPRAFGAARFQVLARLGDTKRARARFVNTDLRKLHSLDQTHRLLGGKGLSWATSGERADFPVNPQSFPSFDDVRDRAKERSQQRCEAWQKWNQSLAEDPRIAVRYDFVSDAPALTDSDPTQSRGLIIGCKRTNGRWGEKGAQEFKRPSDRARHYFNGREISAESIHFDQALEIGPADIGNWGVPFGRDKHPARNFVGRMDELTLWKVALKADELQTMYRQTKP